MPGFPSQFSPELWQQARDLVANGMTFPEVASVTGIGLENLYKRSQREGWTVPSTILAKAQEAVQKRHEGEQVSTSVQTEAILAESIAEKGKKGALWVVDGLLEVIKRTFDPSSALMSKEITSHKEAASMFGTFAKASGLDRPQIAIQTNVWQQSDECQDSGNGP